MTIEDVSARPVIPATSNPASHASPIRKSRNGLRQHGFVPESAWLLHCKEQFGLVAPETAPKENPCPPEKVAAIKGSGASSSRWRDRLSFAL
jgi:hypothetical protein